MGLVEDPQIAIPDKETLDRRINSYDVVREFVDFPPVGVHKGYPNYDKQLRPHRRAKDTIILISGLTEKDYEALYSDKFLRPDNLPNEVGAVIKLHSGENPTYPDGIWASYFDPQSQKYSPISKPRGCLTKSGQIQSVEKYDEISITASTEKQFDVLTRAITEGRIKPCEQGLIDRIAPNTIFRK